MTLDLHDDGVSFTRALCDIRSVSGDEARLADAVEASLRKLGHLEVLRDGQVEMFGPRAEIMARVTRAAQQQQRGAA